MEHKDTYNFDDDFSENSSPDGNSEEEPFFSEDELKEMMDATQSNNPKDIYEKFTKLSDNVEKNVIKPEDYEGKINKFELESILSYKEEQRKKDFYSPMQSTDAILNQADIFRDYLEIPRISGKENVSSDKKLISEENIKATNKKIEISDELGDDDGHHTTIEINRDENNEIEAIIIHCKCGEKTVLKFDYEEGIEEQTGLINSLTKISSFSVEEIELKQRNKKD